MTNRFWFMSARVGAVCALLAAAPFAACSKESVNNGGSGGSSTGPQHEPSVTDVTSTPQTIKQGESFTLDATVTDEDGVDDLVVVTARSSEGFVMGTLTETQRISATEAVFSLVVSWDDLNTIAPLYFDNSQQWFYTVEASDHGAGSASGDGVVNLECHDLYDSACAGTCVDPLTDHDHCGYECEACTSEQVCGYGTCTRAETTVCLDPDTWGSIMTCDEICHKQGRLCVRACGADHSLSAVAYDSAAACDAEDASGGLDLCNEPIDDIAPALRLRCCCDPSSTYP